MVTMNSIIASLRVCALVRMHNVHLLHILTLSLLLVNADDQYCDNLLKQCYTFRNKCSPVNLTIDNCCDLIGFPHSKSPSAVYQMKSCIVPCEVSSFTTPTVPIVAANCDMSTDGGGWIVVQRNKKIAW